MLTRVTLIALALSLMMSVLSAWIRLHDSGIDCEPWPACYGTAVTIDESPGVTIGKSDTNKGLRVIHRFMASVFGLIVLGIVTVAFWYNKSIRLSLWWPSAVFVITIALSIVGMSTPDIHKPIITTINLVGGMLLTITLLHMFLELRAPSATFPPNARVTALSLGIMCVLVTTGAWVSANYAAGACSEDHFSCDLESAASVTEAFDPTRELTIREGNVIHSNASALILFAHEAAGPIAGFVILFCAAAAIASTGQLTWWIAIAPAALTGIVIVTLMEGLQRSVIAASAHNFLSLLILLGLVYQMHQQRSSNV